MKKILLFTIILLPVLLVFKQFFLSNSIAWGDAPHFFKEELLELFREPLAWTSRGNSFGGVNNILWISPLMVLVGAMHKIFNFSGEFIVKIIFYIPSLLLAAFGSYFFAKRYGISKGTTFFTVLIYLLNTYFLLIIDGGQVGVALAYGLFPFVLLFLKKFSEENTVKNFSIALLVSFLCGTFDPRICLIAFLSVLLWTLLEFQFNRILKLLILFFAWICLNFYWIIPLIKNSQDILLNTNLGLIKNYWFNVFLLHSPHWPENIFGDISRPPIFFVGIPILIFLGSFIKPEKRIQTISVLFILIGLISINSRYFLNLPFGIAFRDSTKFYIPILLLSGLLIANTIDKLSKKFNVNKLLLSIFVYFYLLLIVSPAILGKMNFVLSGRQQNLEVLKIYEKVKSEDNFFRTLWIPERHPLTYELENIPALDGNYLVNFAPFRFNNASEDLYNFLNFDNYVNWLRVLGIKYVILSDNPREIKKTDDNLKSWQQVNKLLSENKNLKKVEWQTSIPIYQVENSRPRFYNVKSLVALVGQPIFDNPKSILTLNLEDGMVDPNILQGKFPESISLLFNNADKKDLAMSFLQKYFKSSLDGKNYWAKYTKDQYLKYKYELLIRGVEFRDFDYSKGISFSTVLGEKIEFTFDVPENGDYVFVLRSMIPEKGEKKLVWREEFLNLKKGVYIKTIENNNDITILNVVGLVPKVEYDKAVKISETFTSHFKTVTMDKIIVQDFVEATPKINQTAKFGFDIDSPGWLIFTDNYHDLWKIKHGAEYGQSLPVLSMVNGFYIEKSGNYAVEFKGQKNFRTGVYLSIVSLLVIIVSLLWLSSKPKKEV